MLPQPLARTQTVRLFSHTATTSFKERLISNCRTEACEDIELDAKRTQVGKTCRSYSVERRTSDVVTRSAPFPSSIDEERSEIAKDDGSEADVGTHLTLEELRERSRNNLMSAWESIFLRYGRDFESECDEIDFSTDTPTIVKDRGFIRRAPAREFGKMKLMFLDADAKNVHAQPPQLMDIYACDPELEGFFADGDENEGSETDESGEDFNGCCYDDDDFEQLLQFADAKKKLTKAGRERLQWTDNVDSDSASQIKLQGDLPQIKDDPFGEKGASRDALFISSPSLVTTNHTYFDDSSREETRSTRSMLRRARSLSPTSSLHSPLPSHFLPSPALNACPDPLRRQFHPTPIHKHKRRLPDYFTSIYRVDFSDHSFRTDIESPNPPQKSLSPDLENTDASCTYDSLLPPTPLSISIPPQSTCENEPTYPMDTETTGTTQPNAEISAMKSSPSADMKTLVWDSPAAGHEQSIACTEENRSETPLLPLSKPISKFPPVDADCVREEWDQAFEPLYLNRVLYEGDRCLDGVFSNCAHNAPVEADFVPTTLDEDSKVAEPDGFADRIYGTDSDLPRTTTDEDPLEMVGILFSMEDAVVDQNWAEFERSSGLDFVHADEIGRPDRAARFCEMESKWDEFEKMQAL